MIRNLSFSVCASAFWALLPVIARDQLQLGAGGFGLLSTGFGVGAIVGARSEEHTSELQSLMRISYAVFCLKNNKYETRQTTYKSTSSLHLQQVPTTPAE